MVGNVVGTTGIVGSSIPDPRQDMVAFPAQLKDSMVEEDTILAEPLLTAELRDALKLGLETRTDGTVPSHCSKASATSL
jgi:hypothetical protein